jgi:tripartite ATP-independent transporter DctM subunit
MSPEMIVLIMSVVFLAGMFTGFPAAFVLGSVGIMFGIVEWGFGSFEIFAMTVYSVMDNSIMAAIPLFILMANFLVVSGVSEKLFETAPYLFGPIRGGLAISSMILCILLAACTGIVGSSVTSMGLVALPSMLKHNYKKELALGTVAAGGSLGILIPPSIMLVVMGPMASISVGKLFAAAMVPGILLGLFYILYIMITCWIHPDYGPALTEAERSSVSIGKKVELIFKNMVPTLFLIFGVLGSIFFGVATVTEAASAGCFLSFLLVIFYRRYNWETMKQALANSAKTSTMVLTSLVGASVFTTALFGVGGKKVIADSVTGLQISGWALVAFIIIVIFLLGFILEWIETVPICFPVFLPLVVQAGFDPLWFTALMAVLFQADFLTPPVGSALFYLKGVAPPHITMTDICRGIIPFTAIILLLVLICCVYPEVITWLPRVMFE